jgi:hypothetical protein
MKLDTQISGYNLRKQGSYYLYSDENGRDVFYFDESAERSSFSLNIYLFEDKFINYICSRLTYDQLNESKIVFYIKLLFKRLITYDEFDLHKIRNFALDHSGKLNHTMNTYYLKVFGSIEKRPYDFIFVNTPYSDLYNQLYFSCIQANVFYSSCQEDSEKITRTEFENGLINDDLKLAYLEEYDSNNEFFCEHIGDDSVKFDYFQTVYAMFSNKKLMMVYVN